MANENRISLILEGTQRDGGHVRFDVFLQELQRLQSMLGTLDAAAANGQRNSHFAVVGLSHSSPASVELEARPNRGRIDVSSAIFHLFHRVYEGIEANNIPDDADIKLLEGLKGACVSRRIRLGFRNSQNQRRHLQSD